jgi:peroxiredoxin
MTVNVGDSAPNFTLYDTDKNQVALGDQKGQNVVLSFFPGAFTGVCTTMACTLNDNSQEYNNLNAKVLAISVDPIFAQQEWKNQNNITYTMLSDFNREVVGLYDVVWQNLAGLEGYNTANRAVYIINSVGTVVYKWVAPNPGVEPDYNEIKTTLESL